MSRCVYTGALVFLSDYGACVRGDVFQLSDGQSILIQWGSPGPNCENALDYSQALRAEATHTAIIAGGYHHKQRGITIVPHYNFRGKLR